VRVLVELSPAIDGAGWAVQHAAGDVPDRVPYGLDRLAAYGHDVVVRLWPRSPAALLAGRAVARAGGEIRWFESPLGKPGPGRADFRLCWDERCAIPALLAPRGRKTPLLMGAIWLTEPDAHLAAPLRRLAALALPRADGIFLASTAQLDTLRRDWKVQAGALHVVPFGIDSDFWNPDHELDAEPGRLPGGSVVSVGNDRHRAHSLLLAAFPEIHRRVPAARLNLVTRHPLDVPTELGTRHPLLNHRELRRLYSESAVAVVSTRPNLHCSGLTATLEAMAMGRPVVVTDNPGMAEYVEHGRTGLLVPAGDQDALTEAVAGLLSDPDRAAQLGRNARSEVLQRFTTQRQAEDLSGLIGKLA
jgi:glycosyltransferase involved in cell wall biosynthesis